MIKKPWLALLGLSIIFLNAGIDLTIISTSLPTIQDALQLSLVQAQWLMNIYLLLNCVLLTISGKLSDRYGRRLFLYVSIGLFALSTLMSGLAVNATWLIVGRGIQGIVEAILLPASLGIIAAIFPTEERGRAIGIWSSFVGIGMIIGAALSGIIITHFGWRGTFFIKLPILLIGLILCIISVPESRETEDKKPLDWLGFILISLGITCLIIPIIQGPVWGYTSDLSLALFGIALLSFIAAYFAERRALDPAIPYKLLGNRTFFSCAITQFGSLSCVSSILFLAPLYLRYVYNIAPTALGLMMMSMFIAMFISSPIGGYLVDRLGAKKPLLLGLAALIISALMQSFFSSQTPFYYIVVAFILFGFSWGVILSASATGAVNSIPVSSTGSAIGILWTIQIAGGTIGLAIVGALFNTQYRAALMHDQGLQAITSSPIESKFIHIMLTTHNELKDILTTFPQGDINKLIELFQTAFLHGFNSAMLLLAGITFIASLIVLSIMKK